MRHMLCVGILCTSLTFTHASDRIPSDVREHMAQRIEAGDCVGIVVCVVDEHGSCCASDGVRQIGKDDKVNEKSVFEIGSITKAFTGVLLADMAARGEVSLDDPVERYLPPGKKMPRRGDKEITLRDLANHRAGFPSLPDNLESADPDNPYADYDEKRLLEFLGKHELSRAPGEKYEYSNLGVGLLGYVLARKAGKPYEQLVVERICRPLKMNDTSVALSEDMKSRLAWGHSLGKQVKNWDIGVLGGAGALRSTPLDMVTFVEFNLKLADTPLSKAFQASYKDAIETGREGLSVALGWHIWNKHGTRIIWHNGGTGGYRSFAGFAPDKKKGVVVLTNTDMDLDGVGLYILEPKYELPKIRKTVQVSGETLEPYLGYYELRPGRVMHITRDGDQLFAEVSGQEKFPLFAESETKFFFKIVDAQLTFVHGEGGGVDHLILHQGGERKARRLKDYKPPERKEVNVDPKILASYVGKYEMAPGIEFDVRLEDGQLKVLLTGQPRFPVFPESETKFFYKVVDAQLTFAKDDSGKVTSLILHQGGMDQTAKRKE